MFSYPIQFHLAGNDDGVVFGGCMSDDLFEHGCSEKESPGNLGAQ